MTGYHDITGIHRTTPRSGWRIIHFSQFSSGREITTSHTIGLPGILPHINENIYIRGLGKSLAESILDRIVSLLTERKEMILPGDTVGHEHRKFLVLRENIPPSICTRERSILILHAFEPTERRM